MCLYLLFTVNQGSAEQFAESMVVVALHWNGARILENVCLQIRPDTCIAGLLQTRSFETQKSLSQKTYDSECTIKYPRDPIQCTHTSWFMAAKFIEVEISLNFLAS